MSYCFLNFTRYTPAPASPRTAGIIHTVIDWIPARNSAVLSSGRSSPATCCGGSCSSPEHAELLRLQIGPPNPAEAKQSGSHIALAEPKQFSMHMLGNTCDPSRQIHTLNKSGPVPVGLPAKASCAPTGTSSNTENTINGNAFLVFTDFEIH